MRRLAGLPACCAGRAHLARDAARLPHTCPAFARGFTMRGEATALVRFANGGPAVGQPTHATPLIRAPLRPRPTVSPPPCLLHVAVTRRSLALQTIALLSAKPPRSLVRLCAPAPPQLPGGQGVLEPAGHLAGRARRVVELRVLDRAASAHIHPGAQRAQQAQRAQHEAALPVLPASQPAASAHLHPGARRAQQACVHSLANRTELAAQSQQAQHVQRAHMPSRPSPPSTRLPVLPASPLGLHGAAPRGARLRARQGRL